MVARCESPTPPGGPSSSKINMQINSNNTCMNVIKTVNVCLALFTLLNPETTPQHKLFVASTFLGNAFLSKNSSDNSRNLGRVSNLFSAGLLFTSCVENQLSLSIGFLKATVLGLNTAQLA